MSGGGDCRYARNMSKKFLLEGSRYLTDRRYIVLCSVNPYEIDSVDNLRNEIDRLLENRFPKVFQVLTNENKIEEFSEYKEKLKNMYNRLTERNGKYKYILESQAQFKRYLSHNS